MIPQKTDRPNYQSSSPYSISETDGLVTHIEQLAKTAGKLCPNPGPMLLGLKLESRQAVMMRAPCKRWNCEVCGARNAKRWISKSIYGLEVLGLQDMKMLTITANRKTRKRSQSLWNLRQGWPKLIRRLKYHEHKNITYFRVIEPHKDGALHIHAFAPVTMQESELKGHTAACGMGWSADIEDIYDTGRAAGYVAKYLAKSLAQGNSYPKGIRRVNTSRDWPRQPDAEVAHIYDKVRRLATNAEFEQSAFDLWGEGYTIYLESTGEELTTDSIGFLKNII